MLIVLAERLAQILDWLKTVAGYRVIESSWKLLDLSTIQQECDARLLNGNQRRSSYSLPPTDGQFVTEVFPHLSDWIQLNDEVSLFWLSNLTGKSKEELCRSLVAIDGRDVFVMGVSYSDAQSLSSCRATPKNGNLTLPRCKSYRLQKVGLQSDPRDSVVQRNAACRTIYFSRHGESEYNVQGRVGGDADLSPNGRVYANCLAAYVNRTLSHQPGFRVWTSCLKRTIQTAKDIHAPQEHVKALDELNTGVCDGLTYEEIAERYPTDFAARDEDKFHYQYPQGESYYDLLQRVQPVLKCLENQDNVMIIAHQAVLRCLLAALLNKDDEELPYINAPLHTIMRLSFKSGDACHLELIPLSVECVDTHRAKPENCSIDRSAEEALVTCPAHF